MEENFGDHNSIRFKITLNWDKSVSCREVLNWSKENGTIIRQEQGRVKWEKLLLGKSTSVLWEMFKGQLIKDQDRYVPAGDTDDKVRESG